MLKVTLHEPRPLIWWFEQHLRERIDLDPPYQRRSDIWSVWKRAHLIDSLLNDFDVPKFYVANFVGMPAARLNAHKKAYAIIDGKQRFKAIFDFFSDELPLNATTIFDDDPERLIGKLRYSELKTRYPLAAAKIENFVPTVMSVLTDEQHKIEELFVRLNSGEAATGSERRNAMAGPIPPIIRELVLHPFFQKKIKFATKRMQEHNLAWKLLLLEVRDGFVDTKAKNLDELAEEGARWAKFNELELQNDRGLYAEARNRVVKVLDTLTAEFDDSDPLLGSQGHIPVYYWIARENPELMSEFRDFLDEFTREVKDNLQLQKTAPKQADPELVSYYTMGRTTNDQGSLQGRYTIMLDRLRRFRRPQGRRR